MNIWLYININYSVNNGQVKAWTNTFIAFHHINQISIKYLSKYLIYYFLAVLLIVGQLSIFWPNLVGPNVVNQASCRIAWFCPGLLACIIQYVYSKGFKNIFSSLSLFYFSWPHLDHTNNNTYPGSFLVGIPSLSCVMKICTPQNWSRLLLGYC